MKKDLIFFGEQGLTATSANNIANRAKESVNRDMVILNRISLVNKSIGLLSGGEPKIVGVGVTDLSAYAERINGIKRVNSLIAWLREGIKAKERLTEEVDDLGLYDYLKIVGKEIAPEPVKPVRPTVANAPTEDDIISEWSIGDRQRWYSLGAIASVCADFVGPKGSMNKARKELANAIACPNEVSGDGQNTIVTSYEPSVSVSDADAFFFAIEKEWTDANSELNGMKKKVEDAIKDAERKNELAYNEELKVYNSTMAEYKHKYDAWKDEYNNLLDELQAYKTAELARIKALKIIIPNALKETYESVKALAK